MTTYAPPFVPACMDADELAAWADANGRTTSKTERAARPCADCLLAFAIEMRAAGRCNGTPKGVEEDEEMDGNGSMAALAAAAAGHAGPHPRDTPLEVEAPACGSCAHEPVCALRQAIEKLGRIVATRPDLPDGLRLSLRAVIECGHYARDRAKPAPVHKLTSGHEGLVHRRGAGDRQVSEETRERMRQAALRTIAERRAAAGGEGKPA